LKSLAVIISFVVLPLFISVSRAQWIQQNPILQGITFNSVKFVSSSIGWAVGYNGVILKTTNGGTTWISQSCGTSSDLFGVFFTDPDHGTVVGDSIGYAIIFKTIDGGNTWTQQVCNSARKLSSVFFTDVNTGTAVGYGTILRTTDGGTNWISQSVGGWYYLLDVCFCTPEIGIVVGYDDTIYPRDPHGIILKTFDGGTHWQIQERLSGFTPLSGVSFSDANNGFVVGLYNIQYTSDGGSTWVKLSTSISDELKSVSFINRNNATAVGQNGTIARTTDGGLTWSKQSSRTSTTLLSVSFTDTNNGTAVGFNSTILRTTNGGVTFIGNENIAAKPQDFSLSQNFPNPFNPSTTINYSIPKAASVKLTVYNSIGSNVATLVNEYKPAGNYSVQFNRSNLTSGIYLYRLESGNYNAAKKFILMK
jgi:photosystem II stability/assembly factor-like uncharacterized protein